MLNRVVVTGIGVVSPVGNNVGDFWSNLCDGQSGIDLVSAFNTDSFASQIGGEVKSFDLKEYGVSPKEARKMARFSQFAVAASLQALKDADLNINDEAANIGVRIGSGIGGIEVLEKQKETLINKGPGRCSPFMIPMMIGDMASGWVAIVTGAKGHNSSTTTACASGTHSIGDAFRSIQCGDAVAMIAGGAEAAITPLSYAGFCAAKSLSKNNANPQKASRPFDQQRDGFVMGEGSGVVILEELNHAKKRGAKIYAEILGYGASGDAYHVTAPAPMGEGGSRAMKAALQDAKINPDQVEYINAHGTSTELNDKLETQAIKTVFGPDTKVAVSSTKSMTGHLLGAAGGIECIAMALAIDKNIIPPTINYEYPDPECNLDYVPNVAREATVNIAMSNSFGFGGHNAILVAGKFKE